MRLDRGSYEILRRLAWQLCIEVVVGSSGNSARGEAAEAGGEGVVVGDSAASVAILERRSPVVAVELEVVVIVVEVLVVVVPVVVAPAAQVGPPPAVEPVVGPGQV